MRENGISRLRGAIEKGGALQFVRCSCKLESGSAEHSSQFAVNSVVVPSSDVRVTL
jgi:hypothetical protein